MVRNKQRHGTVDDGRAQSQKLFVTLKLFVFFLILYIFTYCYVRWWNYIDVYGLRHTMHKVAET